MEESAGIQELVRGARSEDVGDRVVGAGRRIGGQMVREERRWEEKEEDSEGERESEDRREDGKGG